MKKIKTTLIFVLVISIFSTSCKKDEKFNLFSVQDDIEFGAQFDREIMSNRDFVILDERTYSEAYATVNHIKNKLLSTGKVSYADRFNWTVRIIDDPTVNAFAVPGGYIYFYTGLIKMLDDEAQFVGVMAHEMAHIARRHSTAQLTKAFGIDLMLSMLLGKNSNQWVNIAAQLASGMTQLKFSRDDEFEADKYAVIYTYPTEWDARGVASFFEKLDSQPHTPVFLSTHPADKARIAAVNKEWEALGGEERGLFEDRYRQFVSSLP
ncbi:MAG: M48 family metalloprotease [Bacteroidetes bacterium]|nr:M48 family metalloprotease [Bacteroidota bacterium]MCL2301976.1 M48 family metalloprotease [Lentimicrobiaceae bacterium]